MIRSAGFWETESGAPLLNRNARYMSPETADVICQRAALWVDLAEQQMANSCSPTSAEEEAAVKATVNAETSRIFDLDAVRTFSDELYRKKMVEVLTAVYRETQDYHQGLGFVVAFLLLVLEPRDVEKVVIAIHRHIVPGYFKSAPADYVRDAKVFEKVLVQRYPEAGRKIVESIAAEAYCSKWFVGMNVHVLTFEAIMDFIDALLARGHIFLFAYALSLVQNCHDDIVEAKGDVSQILAILRLDPKIYPNDKTASASDKGQKEEDAAAGDDKTAKRTERRSLFSKIVEDALAFEVDSIDMDGLRAEVEMEMAEAAERRRLRDIELGFDDESDGIVFSDEE